jgi:Flp pilus assembly protein TadG
MMKTNYSKNQRGVVTVLVVMALPVLLLIMGLALDFGHVFVNKTRLQNALDATALSAAIAINGDIAKSTATAETKGKETFNLFKVSSGNNSELSDLTLSSANFEYSRTLQPWVPKTTFASNDFVFVKVSTPDKNLDGTSNMSTPDELNVIPWLIRIVDLLRGLPNKNITITDLATAGPGGANCCLAPFFFCADMSKPEPLYGYTPNIIYDLNQIFCSGKTCDETTLKPGNYGLLNLPGNKGANDIYKTLIEPMCTNACGSNSLPLQSQTGNDWGRVSPGVDYRIETLDSQHNDYFTQAEYDKYIAAGGKVKDLNNPTIVSHPSAAYLAAGGNGMRIMAAPLADCSTMKSGYSGNITRVGTVCVFFSQKTYTIKSNKIIPAEIAGSCENNGPSNPNDAVLNGPYKIVLFKSPASGDS